MPKLEELRLNITTLLANIVARGESVDLGKILSWEEIPADFTMLRRIHEAIHNTQTRGLPPNADNIIESLKNDSGLNGEEAQKVVEGLLKHQSKFGNIEHLGVWVREAVAQVAFQEGIEEILRIINTPEGTPQQRWERALTVWGSIQSLNTGEALELDAAGRFNHFRNRQRERWERARKGLSIGPSLKFRDFVGKKRIRYIHNDVREQRDTNGDIPWCAILEEKDEFISEEWLTEPAIPILQDGDVTLVTAEPKKGKSTLAGIWAEHNAYTLGHMVLVLQLETDQDSSEIRALARDMFIPRDALVTGHINPDATDQYLWNYERNRQGKIIGTEQTKKVPIKEAFDARESYLSSRPGSVIYAYCPGWSVFRIIEAMRMMSLVAKHEGKKLLVIIDYYNKISREGISGDSEANTLSRIADYIKDTTARLGCHTIVFSQETPNENRPSPYGSRGIQQKAQIHLSLQRWTAWEDIPLLVANEDGKAVHMRDSIGRPIYWCKDTDNWDARAILKVIFANDNPGTECRIMFYNAYFTAQDCPKEYASYTCESMDTAEKLRRNGDASLALRR
jgi:hypothetical protein